MEKATLQITKPVEVELRLEKHDNHVRLYVGSEYAAQFYVVDGKVEMHRINHGKESLRMISGEKDKFSKFDFYVIRENPALRCIGD